MVVIENGGINWWVIGLLFLEVVLLFALATPEHAQNARQNETAAATWVFGENRSNRALSFANRSFKAHVVDTKVMERSYEMLIPSDDSRERAGRVGEMTPELFVWVRERLEGFWSMVYGVYHRSALLGFAIIVAIPMHWVAMNDGLTERKIRIFTDGVSTPVYYHGAKSAFGIMMIAPLFLLLLPISVSPSIWYLWLLLLPGIIWMSARNVQEL